MNNNQIHSAPVPDPARQRQPLVYGAPAYGGVPACGDGGAMEQSGFDPRRILRFILRRWKTVVLLTLVGPPRGITNVKSLVIPDSSLEACAKLEIYVNYFIGQATGH